MDETQIAAVLNSSREHAADLAEAADFITGTISLDAGQPVKEGAAHYEALAARLLARCNAIRLNGGLL